MDALSRGEGGMNHTDHVNLLRPASLSRGGSWADLGAGSGAFTLALRELLGPAATIYAVDKHDASLRELEGSFVGRFGGKDGLKVLAADLSRPLDLPELDGVLMANSLHFFRDKTAILQRARDLLKPRGSLLVVEYNVDKGNPWVPFPVSYESFSELAREAGFGAPRLVGTHPSGFLRAFYCAQTARA